MIERLHSPEQAAAWLRGRVRGTLHTDSRRVGAGDGFIAWPGAARDGRQFVPTALDQGAVACVVEAQGVESYGFDREDVAAYAGLKAASGPIAAAYYEQPSQEIEVLAVTGTNGKTSTSWWLAQALGALDLPCGLIGTLGVGRVPSPGTQEASVVSTGLTTPDPVLLQQTLRRFVEEGLQACAIEASSIGIAERRLDGTHIRTAIFTNFTQDHLDYHASMAAYWQAKAELFDWPGLRAAVLNLDDPKGVELAAALAGRELDLWTVSLRADAGARLTAQDLRMGARGVQLLVCEDEQRVPLSTQVLQALRPLAVQRGGRVWCVFGCGGDRDPHKRPLMGAVAAAHADQVVLTNDNPRSESPEAILAQIRAGVPLARTEPDRAQAIVLALTQADARDVVLVAGKGHEDYQETAGVRMPFSDREQVALALRARRTGARA